MLGFVVFVIIVVLGTLGLVGGLRLLGVVGTEPPRVEPAVGSRELERMQDAILSLERRVDDLQEQQRFLEHLLEARPEGEALPPGGLGPGRSQETDADQSILFDTREED